MPDLIPIPGFSPEDITRKARSALDKLRDNYHLLSASEATSLKPIENTKLVSSFITHIHELHTVELSADKWSSELMGITTLSPFAYQNHFENMKNFDPSSYKGYFMKCDIHDSEGLEFHAHPLQNSIWSLNYELNAVTAIHANLPITVQQFDRELDSADHSENLNVKSVG